MQNVRFIVAVIATMLVAVYVSHWLALRTNALHSESPKRPVLANSSDYSNNNENPANNSTIDDQWHQLMQPGTFAATAHRAFRRFLQQGSLQHLAQLPPAQLCARRFAVFKSVPNKSWGNSFNALATTFWYGVLANRTIVLAWRGSAPSSLHLVDEVPMFADVERLRNSAGCTRGAKVFVLFADSVVQRDPRELNATFLDFDGHNRMAMWSILSYFERFPFFPTVLQSFPADTVDLLLSPAFNGIVATTAGVPADAVKREVVEYFRQQEPARPDVLQVSVHIRHRLTNWEASGAKCLANTVERYYANFSTIRLEMANDWNTTQTFVGMFSSHVASRHVYFSHLLWSDVVQLRPESAHELMKIGQQAHRATPFRSGWWGESPSSFGLVDLFRVGLSRADAFFGSPISTFTEVGIGLFFFKTNKAIAMNDPSIVGVLCYPLTPHKFARIGINEQIAQRVPSPFA